MIGLWRGGAPLVLASKSSARRRLLAATLVPFQICDAAIDERGIEVPLRAKGANGAEIASHLARAKAQAVAARMPGRLILGADQTLSIGGSIFTKPVDRAAAFAQLEYLSGRTHELYSALSLVRADTVLFEAVRVACLTVRPLSRAFIDAYLDLMGEAALSSVGAYQIEGFGIHLFEKVDGDHATILGLPLLPLLAFLREQGLVLA